MKAKGIRRAVIAIAMCLLCVCCFGCVDGCTDDGKPKERESEYYTYVVREANGVKAAHILSLTQKGAAQTALVLPRQLGGYPVKGIGYTVSRGCGSQTHGGLYSKNAEKVYMPDPYDNEAVSEFPYAYIVRWAEESRVWDHIRAKGTVFGYDLYKNLQDAERYRFDGDETLLLANVSYMYNYDRAPSGGYYWVDSCDNDVIDFVPPPPAREGYRFDGWYKEAACVHAWDFATDGTDNALYISLDTVPTERNDALRPLEYTESDGIKLYAKWTQTT